MNFSTEFNLNDHVWFMKGDKPVEAVVSSINIFEVGTDQSHIKYNARDVNNSTSWIDHQHLFEGKLFKSKCELLASL
ncbi:MAG: hypothetical protein V3R25_10130 [Nitrosomonadaceae bacterium]